MYGSPLSTNGYGVFVASVGTLTVNGGTVQGGTGASCYGIFYTGGGQVTLNNCILSYYFGQNISPPVSAYANVTFNPGTAGCFRTMTMVFSPTSNYSNPGGAYVLSSTSYTYGGTSIAGSATVPAGSNTLTIAGSFGVAGTGTTGTYNVSNLANGKIASGTTWGPSLSNTGTRTDCPATAALTGTSYGNPSSPIVGTFAPPLERPGKKPRRLRLFQRKDG